MSIKKAAVTLVVTSLFTLAACSGNTVTEPDKTSTPTPTQSTEPTPTDTPTEEPTSNMNSEMVRLHLTAFEKTVKELVQSEEFQTAVKERTDTGDWDSYTEPTKRLYAQQYVTVPEVDGKQANVFVTVKQDGERETLTYSYQPSTGKSMVYNPNADKYYITKDGTKKDVAKAVDGQFLSEIEDATKKAVQWFETHNETPQIAAIGNTLVIGSSLLSKEQGKETVTVKTSKPRNPPLVSLNEKKNGLVFYWYDESSSTKVSFDGKGWSYSVLSELNK